MTMFLRRHILKRLKAAYDKRPEPDAFVKLDDRDLIGTQKDPSPLNQLVAEQLVLMVRDIDNKPVLRLNSAKMEAIQRELRWYRDPTVQFTVGTLIAIAALVWEVVH